MRVPEFSPSAVGSCLRTTVAFFIISLLALALAGCGGGGSGVTTPPTPPPPIIITVGLPDGIQGVAYSFTLQALSGQTPYTWSVSVGTLPAGLALNSSTGVISGTPTTPETKSFTITITDAANQTDTQEYTVSIGAVTAFVERVSLGVGGVQANSDSGTPSLSDDGRFMAFTSFANNLVATDTNNFPDIFLRDFSCNQNVLVSVSSSGTQANNISFSPMVSGLRSSDNHVMVVYVSTATNLVAGDTNGGRDVFLTALDATSCPPVVVDTIRISVATDGTEAKLSDTQPPSSLLPSISANGQVIAYQSDAANLDPLDINSRTDVFVTDVDFSGGALSVVRTRRISLFPARIPIGVGRTTADLDHVGPDRIGKAGLGMTPDEHIGREVFILQGIGIGQVRTIVDNDATTLIVDPPWNPEPNATSVFVVLSRELITADIFSDTTIGSAELAMQDDEFNGNIIEIVSGAGAGQRRRISDTTPTTFTLATAWSPLPDGTSVFRLLRQGGADSLRGRISPDASSVIFDTGSVFEEEDDNQSSDLFFFDLATGDIERLTRTYLNRPGNGPSSAAALTGTADQALFITSASNLAFLVGPVEEPDIFSTTTIGKTGLGLTPSAHVDQFVLILEGVGRGSSRPITANTATTITVEAVFNPVPDATSVFAITDDTNILTDVYLLDRNTSQFSRVSLASDGSQDNGPEDPNALISSTGSAIVFSALANNIVPGDHNGVRDIYLRNLNTSTNSRISRALGDTNPNSECVDPAFSLDGSTVAFSTTADNMISGDTNSARDIFLVNTGISDPPNFVFSKVANASVGQSFSKQLSALGGTGPRFYSLGGGSLPPGIFLDPSTGMLSGVPQKAGHYQFTLVVSDSARPPQQSRKTVTLVVDP